MAQTCGKIRAEMCVERYGKSPHVCWETIKKVGAKHQGVHRCGFCKKEWRKGKA